MNGMLYTDNGIPVVDLDTKLAYLRTCIVDESFEDAHNHLNFLSQSIQLRELLASGRMQALTPNQHKMLRYTEVLDMLEKHAADTWNLAYPDRRPWSRIGEEAQKEWMRVLCIFQAVQRGGGE